MGLLDWLSDSLGSSSLMDSGSPGMPGSGSLVGGLDPMGSPTGQMEPLPTAAPSPISQPMPPVQGAGMDAPPLPVQAPAGPMPPGGDPMQSGGLNPGGLPPSPPVPLPMARPPGLGAPAPAPVDPNFGKSTMPPGPAPAAPDAGPAGVIDSYRRAGGTMMDPGRADIGPGSGAHTLIGRALGMDANTESQLRGSLGAGLKAAGENSNKGMGAAFAGSLGAGIEGGKKADDKTVEQQDKYLQRAIQAKREGNQAEYQKNYLQYQIAATKEKLQLAKEKQASGSGSVMNSPEQLYLRADALATSQAGALKLKYAKTAEQFGVDSKEAKAALDEYNKGMEDARQRHYSQLGLDPKKAAEIGKKPGMSDQNPVKDFPKDPAGAQKAFEALPPGAYFINPKDGRLLRKKGAPEAAAPGQQVSGLTPPLPPMPMDPYDPLNSEAA